MNLSKLAGLKNKQDRNEVVNEPVYRQETPRYEEPRQQQYQQPASAPQPTYNEYSNYGNQQQQPQHSQPVYQQPVARQEVYTQPVENNYRQPSMNDNRGYGNRPAPAPAYGHYTNELDIRRDTKQMLIETLHKDPESDIEVYTPTILNVEPIEFRDIKDTKGFIAQRVMRYEKELGLSVVPFDLARINKNVVEIMGYHIFEYKGKKYASAMDHCANNIRLSEYKTRWYEMITSGELIDESLVIIENTPYGEIETMALNRFEIDTLLGLFRNANAVVYFEGGDLKFAAGL